MKGFDYTNSSTSAFIFFKRIIAKYGIKFLKIHRFCHTIIIRPLGFHKYMLVWFGDLLSTFILSLQQSKVIILHHLLSYVSYFPCYSLQIITASQVLIQ
jgi:hypothetical protein